ncbi:30452_t:CDS:2, partial [Gigaspora margarita]
SFSEHSKEVSLGGKQFVRCVWNLSVATKNLEEIKKDLQEKSKQAIIRATESMLLNKFIRTPKKQLVPNKEHHISKAYMNLDWLISEIKKSDISTKNFCIKK